MIKKVALISLGCSKNLVDSEQILALFADNGFLLTSNYDQADVIIINTCGFIEPARQEARQTIEKILRMNKVTIVCGCYVEKYQMQLKALFPKVNLFIKHSDYSRIIPLLSDFFNQKLVGELSLDRRKINDHPYAYLRIADGCNKQCAYCLIPSIRGPYVSVPQIDLVRQAIDLEQRGFKELILIAQDATSYGFDLKDGSSLASLLIELEQRTHFVFIRVLYMYPTLVTDQLLEVFAQSQMIVPYFDLPLQHINDRILRLMKRAESQAINIALYQRIKKQIPHAIFRTTFITGFPSETEEEFKELLSFIEEYPFTHLGVFTYSKEEGTIAGQMADQISELIKNNRRKRLLIKQNSLSYMVNQTFVGMELIGIVDQKIAKDKYTLRTYFNAPDDIDGNVVLTSFKELKRNEVVKIKITKAHPYDLDAELVN